MNLLDARLGPPPMLRTLLRINSVGFPIIKINSSSIQQKKPAFAGFFTGCPTWIRTKIDGFKGRCPAIGRSGNTRGIF